MCSKRPEHSDINFSCQSAFSTIIMMIMISPTEKEKWDDKGTEIYGFPPCNKKMSLLRFQIQVVIEIMMTKLNAKSWSFLHGWMIA